MRITQLPLGRMRKVIVELPKYRLQIGIKLTKRRGPLLEEPVIPTPTTVKRKYRKGTFLGKLARYMADHRSIRKFFAVNFAAVAITASMLPVKSTGIYAAPSDDPVIQSQNTLETQKTTVFPLSQFKLNQGFSVFHPGVDLGAKIGDPVKPMRAGEIQFASYSNDGYGNLIVIDHGNGLTSRYAHLSKIFVSVGQKVNTNSVIGLVGITGHSTGPHLHFEVRLNEVPQNPLDYFPIK